MGCLQSPRRSVQTGGSISHVRRHGLHFALANVLRGEGVAPGLSWPPLHENDRCAGGSRQRRQHHHLHDCGQGDAIDVGVHVGHERDDQESEGGGDAGPRGDVSEGLPSPCSAPSHQRAAACFRGISVEEPGGCRAARAPYRCRGGVSGRAGGSKETHSLCCAAPPTCRTRRLFRQE